MVHTSTSSTSSSNNASVATKVTICLMMRSRDWFRSRRFLLHTRVQLVQKGTLVHRSGQKLGCCTVRRNSRRSSLVGRRIGIVFLLIEIGFASQNSWVDAFGAVWTRPRMRVITANIASFPVAGSGVT
jgi:hypothetical protein